MKKMTALEHRVNELSEAKLSLEAQMADAKAEARRKNDLLGHYRSKYGSLRAKDAAPVGMQQRSQGKVEKATSIDWRPAVLGLFCWGHNPALPALTRGTPLPPSSNERKEGGNGSTWVEESDDGTHEDEADRYLADLLEVDPAEASSLLMALRPSPIQTKGSAEPRRAATGDDKALNTPRAVLETVVGLLNHGDSAIIPPRVVDILRQSLSVPGDRAMTGTAAATASPTDPLVQRCLEVAVILWGDETAAAPSNTDSKLPPASLMKRLFSLVVCDDANERDMKTAGDDLYE